MSVAAIFEMLLHLFLVAVESPKRMARSVRILNTGTELNRIHQALLWVVWSLFAVTANRWIRIQMTDTT